KIFKDQFLNSHLEIVERKGIGHPDTLADLIAEEVSNKYSRICLKIINRILNHWFDKVVVSGGTALVDYGIGKMIKPITVYLFGKVDSGKIGKEINLSRLFKNSTERIFKRIFYTQKEILYNLQYVIDVNSGVGKEYSKKYYQIDSLKDFKRVKPDRFANDTVMCEGHYPLSKTEILAITLENFINSKIFKKDFPATGWDVKVLIVRENNYYDITVCIPFIASKTPTFNFYFSQKELIKKTLSNFLKKKIGDNFSLFLNTKDRERYGYLTVFGTALDKGDFGVVGRGNRYSGVISVTDPCNIEAPFGKNPTHHAGKIYTILAYDLAYDIYKLTKNKTRVFITSRNGDLLQDPANIIVQCSETDLIESKIRHLIEKRLKLLPKYPNLIVRLDPIANHRKRKIPLLLI
ncbi:MAG: methionine adenosyltransferase, partial [Candidatus Aenigmatarchaeota archaeon]